MVFFKKGIETEQGTQKTPKTGKRKSKNDHASAVRVQKVLNRPFFTRGQTVYFLPANTPITFCVQPEPLPALAPAFKSFAVTGAGSLIFIIQLIKSQPYPATSQ